MKRTNRKVRTDRRKRREQIEQMKETEEREAFFGNSIHKKRDRSKRVISSVNVSSCLFEWLSSLISHAAIAQQVVSITKNGLTSTIPKQLASSYATDTQWAKYANSANQQHLENHGKHP